MSEQQSFFPLDAETTATVKRYEDFRSGKAAGYFEVDELSDIIDYYLFNGMTKDCDGVLELGNKLHPNSSELKVKRAKTCFAAGDVRNALRILDTLNNDFDYETIILRIELLQKIGRGKEAQMLANKLFADESADDHNDNDLVCLDLANAFISQNNYDIAMKWLHKGEQINPENIDILLEKALVFEQCEDYEKAEKIYNKIIDIDAFVAEVWFDLAQLHYLKNDFNKALECYNYAAALDEDDMITTLQRAHVLYQLDRYQEAIELYKTYSEATGDIWQANIFIAEAYEQMDKYDEAIDYFEKSLEKYPENYDALIGIGTCLLAQEKFEESIVYIDRALDVQEDEPEAWVYLAKALVGLENVADALLAYTKSLMLEPKQPETLMDVANLLMEDDQMDRALEVYLAARKLDSSLEFIDLFISICYFCSENNSMGIVYLRSAIDANPKAKELFLEICPEFKKFLKMI